MTTTGVLVGTNSNCPGLITTVLPDAVHCGLPPVGAKQVVPFELVLMQLIPAIWHSEIVPPPGSKQTTVEPALQVMADTAVAVGISGLVPIVAVTLG